MSLRRSLLIPALLLLTACSPEEPIREWQVAFRGLYSASFSPDGADLVIGSVFHGASLWNTPEYRRVYNWNHHSGEYTEVFSTAISDNREVAATAEDKSVVVWSVASGRSLAYWDINHDIWDMHLTEQGRFLLIASNDSNAYLYDAIHGGELRRFHHQGPVRSSDISETAKLVITGSEDNQAFLWDLRTGKKKASWKMTDTVTLVRLSENARLALVFTRKDGISIFSTATGRLLKKLKTRNEIQTSAIFTGPGTLMTGSKRGVVRLWNLKDGKKIKSWQLPEHHHTGFQTNQVLAMAPAGSNYLAAGSDGYLYLLRQ